MVSDIDNKAVNGTKSLPASLLRSPVNFLALGFGSGLAPGAPGTVGTLPAVLLWVPLSFLHWSYYLVVVTVLAVAGVWICGKASEATGQHDHGSIVWDEIVGFLITMIAIPFSLAAMIIGFLLFRVFDIFKPWPISWLDKRVGGGLGIMLDDVVAGLLSCAILHVLMQVFPALF